jgi:hypothetical protein
MRIAIAIVVLPAFMSCATSDAHHSDEIMRFPGLETVDGGPQPSFRDAVAIHRNAWSLFGGYFNAAYSIARVDEARVALACTPGNAPPADDDSMWPTQGRHDPPEWNPPQHGAPGVTSCASEPRPNHVVVVRQELDDDVVRYFVVVRGGNDSALISWRDG